MMDKHRDLERVWQRSDRRRSAWLERAIREDPLGVRVKSLIAVVAGAVFLSLAILERRWGLGAFGLVILAAGVLSLRAWRRQHLR